MIKLSIDINNLVFIPEESVPFNKHTKWDDILKLIPKGQALILSEEQKKPSAIRQALLRRQKNGRFKHLKMIVRGNKGNRKTYIVNPK